MSVSNFVRTTIKSAVSSGATTIEVDTASSPFNNPPAPTAQARLFLVDSLDSPTKWEEIEYTGRSAITGGYSLTGVTRNEDSSTGSAQSFDAGHYVVQSPSATTDGQGAIVESGTNSNGSYIRFESGVQICWSVVVTMNYASGFTITGTWTFPAAFNVAPAVFHTPTGGVEELATTSRDTIGIRTNSIGTTSAALELFSNNSFTTGDSMDTYGQAYGFWK